MPILVTCSQSHGRYRRDGAGTRLRHDENNFTHDKCFSPKNGILESLKFVSGEDISNAKFLAGVDPRFFHSMLESGVSKSALGQGVGNAMTVSVVERIVARSTGFNKLFGEKNMNC